MNLLAKTLLIALLLIPALAAANDVPSPSPNISVPADPKTGLTIGQVRQVATGLAQLDCAPHLIKDGAKESMACVPNDWSPGISWLISGNSHKCEDVIKRYYKWRNEQIAKLPRKSDGSVTADAEASFALQDGDYLNLDSGITLQHFKKSDLEGKKIPPSVLENLWTIIDD